MRVGIVGLGRMGSNLAQAAIEHGHQVVGHDRFHDLDELAGLGLEPAPSLDDLARLLAPPRIVLIYVPHGAPTEQVCEGLRHVLEAGFARRDILFVDMGTSGGINGARHGACFMAGGDARGYALVEPLLKDLAFDDRATRFVGEPGSGHFAKLIHNAIEFGMVQAIAEGVELLERSDFTLDLPALFDNWAHGSVIRSWLVELMRDALHEHPDLRQLSTYVEDTGEVKWVLEWALDRDIPSPVISDSQQALMAYRDLDWPAAKTVALLRHGFGGHSLHHADEQLVRS
jgi:6-phosphogluconate dehydrogenase